VDRELVRIFRNVRQSIRTLRTKNLLASELSPCDSWTWRRRLTCNIHNRNRCQTSGMGLVNCTISAVCMNHQSTNTTRRQDIQLKDPAAGLHIF